MDSSVQSLMSDSLRPHGLQHARLACPSPTPRVYSLMPIELVMPCNYLILCCPLFLLPSIFPGIRVFYNESVLHIRWPKYWSVSFSISPSNEYFRKCSLGISNLLEEISSLSHSIVFLYLHWSLRKAFLSPCYSLEFCIQMVYLSFSHLSLASLLFSAVWKASSENHFAFLHFFFSGMVLITASRTMLQTSVHSSSGTLSIRSNPLNHLSLLLYNHKGFHLQSGGFPYFLQFKAEFCSKGKTRDTFKKIRDT